MYYTQYLNFYSSFSVNRTPLLIGQVDYAVTLVITRTSMYAV
jgi:hypothetical protein